MSQEKPSAIKAQVRTVITTNKEGQPLMKTREDGTLAPYALCGVVITEGKAKGKSAWANRTLRNREGVDKANVEVGQDVFVIPSIVKNRETNKPMVMLEISTSVNASNEELLDAFGLTEAVAEEPKEVLIPLDVTGAE